MLHNLAAPAAATIVSVATGLNNGDISNLKVSPNFTFFPFMQLMSDMVGGLSERGSARPSPGSPAV